MPLADLTLRNCCPDQTRHLSAHLSTRCLAQAWAGGGAEAAAVRALLTRAMARSLQAPRGL